MAETRKDKRAPVSLRVRFKSASVDEFIEQFSHDISRGGIFIKTKTPMNIGTLLKFEFQLKDESRLIHGVGRVVWRRDEVGATAESPAGMGIKFIKMDADSRAVVERISEERGDAPAAFEAGTDGPPVEKKEEAAPAPFFPETLPDAEQPLPEDRTQVRHASEFLASALGAETEPPPPTTTPSEPPAPSATEDRVSKSTMIGAAFALSPEARAMMDKERDARAEKDAAEAERKAAEEKAAEEKKHAEEKAAAEKAEKKAAEDRAAEDRAAEERAAQAKAEAERKKAEEQKAVPSKAPQKNQPKTSGAPSDKKKAAAKAAEKKPQRVESKRPQGRESVRPAADEPRSNLPYVLGAVVVLALAYLAWKGLWSDETPSPADNPEITDNATELPNDVENSVNGSGTEETLPPVEAPPVETPSAESPPVEEATVVDAATTPQVAPTPTEPEPAPAPTAPTVVSVRVESTPPGAEVTVAGASRGTTPLSIDLPAGTESTLALRLAGHAPFSQSVTPPAEGRPPVVRARLTALPYEIAVETSPSGARVTGARRTAVAPGVLAVGRVGGPLTLTATLAGYQNATTTVRPTDFVEDNGTMRARVSLTLQARPTPPSAQPTEPGQTPRPRNPRPAQEEPDQPTNPPEETPRPPPPSEIPDNPFG